MKLVVMRAEQRVVEPDLALGALLLTANGFVCCCPFVDTVRFPCLLGCCLQAGISMTFPAQCIWLAYWSIITCLYHWNGSTAAVERCPGFVFLHYTLIVHIPVLLCHCYIKNIPKPFFLSEKTFIIWVSLSSWVCSPVTLMKRCGIKCFSLWLISL